MIIKLLDSLNNLLIFKNSEEDLNDPVISASDNNVEKLVYCYCIIWLSIIQILKTYSIPILPKAQGNLRQGP